jgi:hypothetical protein
LVSLFREVRSVAASLAQGAGKRALDRAPENVKEAIEKIRRRYENGRVDARRAMEELADIEEKALRAAFQLLLFPWATAGAIRELYGRIRELEASVEGKDRTIRLLEERIRKLEDRG